MKDGSTIIPAGQDSGQGVRGHGADASVASVKELDLPPEKSECLSRKNPSTHTEFEIGQKVRFGIDKDIRGTGEIIGHGNKGSLAPTWIVMLEGRDTDYMKDWPEKAIVIQDVFISPAGPEKDVSPVQLNAHSEIDTKGTQLADDNTVQTKALSIRIPTKLRLRLEAALSKRGYVNKAEWLRSQARAFIDEVEAHG